MILVTEYIRERSSRIYTKDGRDKFMSVFLLKKDDLAVVKWKRLFSEDASRSKSVIFEDSPSEAHGPHLEEPPWPGNAPSSP